MNSLDFNKELLPIVNFKAVKYDKNTVNPREKQKRKPLTKKQIRKGETRRSIEHRLAKRDLEKELEDMGLGFEFD